jgi:hypothetical protein
VAARPGVAVRPGVAARPGLGVGAGATGADAGGRAAVAPTRRAQTDRTPGVPLQTGDSRSCSV